MRFVIHDDEGPIRTFHTKKEAVDFLTGKRGLRLVELPKPPKPPSVFETTEPAVF